MKKKIISILLAASLSLSSFTALAADLPSEFWGLNEQYGAAVQNKDYAATAQYGSSIVDLILKEPANEQNSNIIGSRAYETAFAYYFLGDYANAVKYFNIYIPYGIEQNWPDGVKIAREFVKYLSPNGTSLYKYTNTEQKYYGARNEPHGVLYGQVSETSAVNESMVLLYLEYGNIANFDWAKVVLDRARQDGKAVELALNFVNEGNDVRAVTANDAYLTSLAQFLSSYTDIPIYLRIGAEMNIWGNTCTPDEFKSAFRIIASKLRAMPNIASVWSAAHTSRWQSADWPYTVHDFYPGDEYVDWVGVNAYPNKYFNGQTWEGIDKFNEVCFKTGYNSDPVLMIKEFVDAYGDRKPIMISECGSAYRTNGSVNETHEEWGARRLREMYAFIPMVYPQVKLMAYFNKNISHEYNYYELTGSQQLASAYNEAVKQPWFVKGAHTNAAQTYLEKVYDTISTDGTVTLGAYPYFYGADTYIVDYYLDGQLVQSAKTPPYKAELTGIKGTHKLSVVTTGSNGAVGETSYTIKSEFNPTGANDFSDTANLNAAQKSAVDYTVKNGIVTGYDDATFRPSNTITRAEFATMVCRMMKYQADSPCSFDDAANHWGSKYIGACVNAGAINGDGGNSFAPDSNITFEQAVKIVSVVSKIADGSESYPDGFIEAARGQGALENVENSTVGAPLSRVDAAVLMYNAVGSK